MIMAMSEDRMMEGVIRGYINPSFVYEDVVIILPIQELRLEGCGDVL